VRWPGPPNISPFFFMSGRSCEPESGGREREVEAGDGGGGGAGGGAGGGGQHQSVD
jgi:hypothetical protein